MTVQSGYHRYHIETRFTPDLIPPPPRFRVRVRKLRLIGLVLKELIEFRGHVRVALSRPCVYGVFSRPVGGLAPKEELCVGCLRCTVQYPEVVQICPNPERLRLGDSYLKPEYVDTILYEARTGRVPVRGAGYRGPFGGDGWDGMWTDMSEIVRPTRDGIHGREFISTAVDIGEKPSFLTFDAAGHPIGPTPRVLSIQVPFVLDVPPPGRRLRVLAEIFAEAARQLETLAILPVEVVVRFSLGGPHVMPLVRAETWPLLEKLPESPRIVALAGWDPDRYRALRARFPESLVAVRVPMDADLEPMVRTGVRVFHLTADYHGYAGRRFAIELIQQAHRQLVDMGLREEVTLIGSGGIVMAEHVPKAIICGLDAVALDTALWVALQARFDGECVEPAPAAVTFPRLKTAWGVQRLKNLVNAWRDQLLEVLGAMGLREVRRLRGEVGRCMFQRDLEREAFAGIEGFGE
ncbi:hypothetical protein HRbin11_00895 [bacterium HR11]|nr:hypothetical protein HRbin11_00895 [bacterium HR11]